MSGSSDSHVHGGQPASRRLLPQGAHRPPVRLPASELQHWLGNRFVGSVLSRLAASSGSDSGATLRLPTQPVAAPPNPGPTANHELQSSLPHRISMTTGLSANRKLHHTERPIALMGSAAKNSREAAETKPRLRSVRRAFVTGSSLGWLCRGRQLDHVERIRAQQRQV